jgi:hypothetical protein
MGNVIQIEDVMDVSRNDSQLIVHSKDGSTYRYIINNEYQLARVFVYFNKHQNLKLSSDLIKKIREANNEKIPIKFLDGEIVFRKDQQNPQRTWDQNSTRLSFVHDMMKYNKLMVHNVHFTAMFNDVLANEPKIYTEEFITKWNTERQKFLDLLVKKIDGMKHGSKL